MKNCLNCGNNCEINDIYCRHCGCVIQKNSSYIIFNLLTFFLLIILIGLIVLIVASFLIK